MSHNTQVDMIDIPGSSHVVPVKPVSQRQRNLSPCTRHSPPFLHGFEAQGSGFDVGGGSVGGLLPLMNKHLIPSALGNIIVDTIP